MNPVENPAPQKPAHKRERQQYHPPERSIAIWGPLLVVLLLALIIIAGVWRHSQQKREQAEFAKKTSELAVNFVVVHRDSKPRELLLPCNIQAFQETTIYARANGYVSKWLVDIGDDVQAGQTLAEIETPEIDQQLAQARANFEIARVTAQRWKDLVEKRVVAPQDFDEKEAAYEAAQANLRQIEQTQGFKKIVAPFSGKITARRVDIGALVSAGSGTAGTSLFSIAQTDPLRVFCYVPQTNAASIREGMNAKILVQEMPGRDFTGKVTRTAGALDPASRTLLTEVQIPNHDSALYAGMYAQLKFSLQEDRPPIVVPGNAFIFRTEGAQVAVLKEDNRIHWQTIQVGRDYGTQLEATDGLTENARVVMNPTDDLQEGIQVQAKPAEQSNPSAGAAPQKQTQGAK